MIKKTSATKYIVGKRIIVQVKAKRPLDKGDQLISHSNNALIVCHFDGNTHLNTITDQVHHLMARLLTTVGHSPKCT